MARYIDAGVLIGKLVAEKHFYPAIVARAIDDTPTADVVEVKHGEWLMCLTDEPWRKGFHGRCSECGATYTYNINKMPRRCDNCDALMDGRRDA